MKLNPEGDMKHISLFPLIVMILWGTLQAQEHRFLKGYASTIRGEELPYESPQPQARLSLLVRSLDARNDIAWETEPLPYDLKGDSAVFVWIAGMDVNRDDPHSFTVYVNESKKFTLLTPRDDSRRHFSWNAPDMRLEYRGISLDKYGDFMGYMYLHLPLDKGVPGRSLRLRVQGESSGSRTWFMIFKYGCANSVSLFAENSVCRTQAGPRQQLRFNLVYLGRPAEADIEIEGEHFHRRIPTGFTCLRLPVAPVTEPREIPVTVRLGSEVLFDEAFTIKPARQLTIYLLHHSHVDIGYTHLQAQVEKMQQQYLRTSIELLKKEDGIDTGTHTKWNTEVAWAAASAWEGMDSSEKREFAAALQAGVIELDALYGNLLTGLCGQEELLRATEAARRLASDCGVELKSAMISDIPGWSWGLIPALTAGGIRYLSLGTNQGHRIGDILDAWGDRPFYWVSPSGADKVLCWIHSSGYSLFHAGLNLIQINYPRYENLILGYADQLRQRNYPYDMVPLRYNIGSDNGPVDTTLTKFVADWNTRYLTPKLQVSTVTEAFSLFEEKYGHTLPNRQGDIGGYWEDGAASSARETALNRRAAQRLIQAQTLWSLLRPRTFTEDNFRSAWKEVLLYDEHTWGAYNSISEPESEFVRGQWRVKREFALSADRDSRLLLYDAAGVQDNNFKKDWLTVYNTSSWTRSGLARLNAVAGSPGLRDDKGRSIPTQTLRDGTLLFWVDGLAPFSSCSYHLTAKNENSATTALKVGHNSLENEWIRIVLDEKDGTIAQCIEKRSGHNLADNAGGGLNRYWYVDGRDPREARTGELIRIEPGEKGPLAASLIVETRAPGCRSLSTEIMIYSTCPRIDIVNTLDKLEVYRPEGVHFGFPFLIKDGTVRISMPFGFFRPEEDQLPGANRNFFSAKSWVDISNQDDGILWISPDAPLVEVGGIQADPIVRGWIDRLAPSQTILSYVMNNYWETNFLAAQEGVVTFQYTLIPHRNFQSGWSERKAREIIHPLIAVRGGEPLRPPFHFAEEGNIHLDGITPMPHGGYHLRLFNFSGGPEITALPSLKQDEWHTSNIAGDDLGPAPRENRFLPFEIRFFLITKKEK